MGGRVGKWWVPNGITVGATAKRAMQDIVAGCCLRHDTKDKCSQHNTCDTCAVDNVDNLIAFLKDVEKLK